MPKEKIFPNIRIVEMKIAPKRRLESARKVYKYLHQNYSRTEGRLRRKLMEELEDLEKEIAEMEEREKE